jgi:hypothetical protein
MNRRETWQKQLEVSFFLISGPDGAFSTPFPISYLQCEQIARRTRSHKHGVMAVPPTFPPSLNWHKRPHGPYLVFSIVSLPSLSAFNPKQRGRHGVPFSQPYSFPSSLYLIVVD